MQNLKVNLANLEIEKLKAGTWLELNGDLIVMRDAAHKRLLSASDPTTEIPLDLHDKIIFYAGPTAGFVENKGVIGPTTSERMDRYVEAMLSLGIKGFLGKGPRSENTKNLLANNKALYMVTIGGAAALLSKFVKRAKIIAYPDLGPEAIYLITVENFPALVALDSDGNSIWQSQ